MIQESYLSKKFTSGNRKNAVTSGNYYVFILIFEQCSVISADGAEIICPEGSLYVIKPGTSVSVMCSGSSSEPFAVALYISCAVLDEISEGDVNFTAEFSAVPARGQLCSVYCSTFAVSKNLVENLASLQFSGYEFGREIYVKSILSILAVYFVRATRNDLALIRKGGKHSVSLEAVCAYISKHIAEEISLETLANEFFIDRSYLNRKFKEATGMTIHRYIIRAKLQLCQKYITRGVPLSEVYRLVGIGGYNNFFRAFKREFGITPKEYYQQWVQENAGSRNAAAQED